jgi:DNA-binding MarR family transcriptional regulator
MPTTDPDAVAAILHELHAINRASRTLLGETPLPGLTRTSAGMLWLVAKRGECRCGDLADALGVDASSVSRRLGELERLGLVRRRPDPADGRAWLNSATPAGTAVLAKLRDRYLTAATASLRSWTGGELTGLATSLARLHADLSATSRTTPTRLEAHL